MENGRCWDLIAETLIITYKKSRPGTGYDEPQPLVGGMQGQQKSTGPDDGDHLFFGTFLTLANGDMRK